MPSAVIRAFRYLAPERGLEITFQSGPGLYLSRRAARTRARDARDDRKGRYSTTAFAARSLSSTAMRDRTCNQHSWTGS